MAGIRSGLGGIRYLKKGNSMQTTTYTCDKCKKKMSEGDIIRVRSMMLINMYGVPDTQFFDICKDCTIDMGIWERK